MDMTDRDRRLLDGIVRGVRFGILMRNMEPLRRAIDRGMFAFGWRVACSTVEHAGYSIRTHSSTKGDCEVFWTTGPALNVRIYMDRDNSDVYRDISIRT